MIPSVAKVNAAKRELQAGADGQETDGEKDRLLVVSDNLNDHDLIKHAVNAKTAVVVANYSEDTLDTLLSKMREAAGSKGGEGEGKLLSVGFIDHGDNGHFCLLQVRGPRDPVL